MPSLKNPSDEGYERFEFRSDTQAVPQWKGVVKTGSSAWPEDFQLREGVNIRPIGGSGYQCRGGQTKATASAATSDMDGIFDASDVGA